MTQKEHVKHVLVMAVTVISLMTEIQELHLFATKATKIKRYQMVNLAEQQDVKILASAIVHFNNIISVTGVGKTLLHCIDAKHD